EAPADPELIQGLTTQPKNIPGLVGKYVSRILVPVVALPEVCSYPVNPAITVRMEQPAGKAARICHYDGALPWLQLDLPQVLSARPVLREETRPMPGVA